MSFWLVLHFIYHYAECHYARCHYAEYRYAECCILFTIMLNVIMLNVITLSVVAPLVEKVVRQREYEESFEKVFLLQHLSIDI
jgi:hypothetical protein